MGNYLVPAAATRKTETQCNGEDYNAEEVKKMYFFIASSSLPLFYPRILFAL
jgi:hypothetical protein